MQHLARLSTISIENVVQPTVICSPPEQLRMLSSSYGISTKEIIDLRVTFLAFTTDTITRYALGESKNLQKNRTLAVEWSSTIRAVAKMTPLMKQFPWMMTAGLYIPISVLQLLMPEFSRLVQYHKVSLMTVNKATIRSKLISLPHLAGYALSCRTIFIPTTDGPAIPKREQNLL
ncbi:cytochrome P450 protein [Rutstroemia sp. NJR-2017a BBW]|nr:cytochrome P450 protein [Rutstroemia sp. NJR-2017a BBW]